ncbi:MAG: hypothetical protein M3014_02920 [Chloroflexota bacterium]|nr:hypothetical protein [Chloroflexota bacterium]
MQITATYYKGFEAYKIGTSVWEAVCVPQLGANIAEITHLATGRQWLWQNPRMPLAEHDYGCPYIQGSMSGFDECFPAIAAGPYPDMPFQGVAIPDHGEVWTSAWTVLVRGDALQLSVEGRSFPYRLERTFLVGDHEEMMLHYTLTNMGEAPLLYNWSSHPVFAASAGMRVLLEEGASLLVEGSRGDRLGPQGSRLKWPGGRHKLDVVHQPGGQEVVDKIFAEGVTGPTGLYHPESNSHLLFRYNSAEINTVGIWLSIAGLPEEHCVAVEPCKGNTDSLAGSLELGTASRLEPGGRHDWEMALAFGMGIPRL